MRALGRVCKGYLKWDKDTVGGVAGKKGSFIPFKLLLRPGRPWPEQYPLGCLETLIVTLRPV